MAFGESVEGPCAAGHSVTVCSFPGESATGAVCSDRDDHVLLTSTPGSLLR